MIGKSLVRGPISLRHRVLCFACCGQNEKLIAKKKEGGVLWIMTDLSFQVLFETSLKGKLSVVGYYEGNKR